MGCEDEGMNEVNMYIVTLGVLMFFLLVSFVCVFDIADAYVIEVLVIVFHYREVGLGVVTLIGVVGYSVLLALGM